MACPPPLSICIPTYNFGDFIGEALESIYLQNSEDVEVVVLDGGSTDNTPTVVQGFTSMMPSLRYFRQEARGGIDRDIARVVEHARGEYCWLFSSDDVMKPGSIARVLGELQLGFDVLLAGRVECTLNMTPVRNTLILSSLSPHDFQLADRESRALYFSRATSTYAFFAYMSSIIVKRSRWVQEPINELFVGTCWAHVARFFGMVPRGLRVRVLPDALVLCRGGNDSFLDRGIVNRIGIAVNGYWDLADRYFGPTSMEARHIRRVVGEEYSLRHLLSAKWSARASLLRDDEQALNVLVSKLYQDPTLKNRARHLAYKHTPLRLARGIYRAFKYRRLSL